MSGETSLSVLGRLRRAWVWVVLQFVLTLVLVAAALAWTRLPDKHIWQVALTLLVPVLLGISALELQAGTMRRLALDDGRRAKLVWGAVTLLVWIGLGVVAWMLLDWCDGRIPLWAGYVNSRFGAHARASLFTYSHLHRGMVTLEWLLRWVAVPVLAIPCAGASSQWGLRLPAGRVLRVLFSIRWWLGVALAALIGVWLPSHFFDKLPSGTVSAQVWSVGVKLGGAYLLAMGCWVTLLAWCARLSSDDAMWRVDGDREMGAIPATMRHTQPVKEGMADEDELHRGEVLKGGDAVVEAPATEGMKEVKPGDSEPESKALEGEVLPPENDPLGRGL